MVCPAHNDDGLKRAKKLVTWDDIALPLWTWVSTFTRWMRLRFRAPLLRYPPCELDNTGFSCPLPSSIADNIMASSITGPDLDFTTFRLRYGSIMESHSFRGREKGECVLWNPLRLVSQTCPLSSAWLKRHGEVTRCRTENWFACVRALHHRKEDPKALPDEATTTEVAQGPTHTTN